MTVTVFSSFAFKDCCVQGKCAFAFLKWRGGGVTNKMGGMTFCMKYIIRGGVNKWKWVCKISKKMMTTFRIFGDIIDQVIPALQKAAVK